MDAGISFAELIAYSDEENGRWREWFGNNEKALELPLDISGTVGGLVHHIFEVERLFAATVLRGGRQERGGTEYKSVGELFAIAEEASLMFREFLSRATPEEWGEEVELRSGLRASRRKCVVHALTHSMRHWAQIATFLRQHGMAQDWRHDLILSGAIR